MPYHEKHTRSIAKAISYRLISIAADTILVFALTHKVELTFGIVVLSNFISLFIYYFHERVWNKFHFGRKIVEDKKS
jgi:adenylylsulfate kinase